MNSSITDRGSASWLLLNLLVLMTAASCASAHGPAEHQAHDGDAAKREMCASGEHVLLACTLASGTPVSLCWADAPNGIVRYVHGRREAPEQEHSAREGEAGAFRRTHLGFAGNTGGYAYSFDDGGRTHVLFSVSGSQGLSRQGIVTLPDGTASPSTAHDCKPGTAIETQDERVIDRTLRWKSDPRVERMALPPAR